MADLLQQDDARGEELVSGAKDREVTRQTEISGEQPSPTAPVQAPQGVGSSVGALKKGASFIGQHKKSFMFGGGGLLAFILPLILLVMFASIFKIKDIEKLYIDYQFTKVDAMVRRRAWSMAKDARAKAIELRQAGKPVGTADTLVDEKAPLEEQYKKLNADQINNISSDPVEFKRTTNLMKGTAMSDADLGIKLNSEFGINRSIEKIDDAKKGQTEIDKAVKESDRVKVQNGIEVGGPLQDISKTIEDNVKSGMTPEEATAATYDQSAKMFTGVASWSTINQLSTLYCITKDIYDQTLGKALANSRTKELVRLAARNFTAADAATLGKLSLKQVGGYNNAFDKGGESFIMSASYKRATHQAVNANPASPGYNADINPNAKPFTTDTNTLFSVLNKAFPNTAAINNVCSILLQPKVQIGVFLVEAAALVVTGGLEAGVTAPLDVAIKGLTTKILTWQFAGDLTKGLAKIYVYSQVLSMVASTVAADNAGAATTGTEKPISRANKVDAGTDILASDSARMIGGRVLTNAESNAVADMGYREQQSQLTLRDRLFNLNNPRSVGAMMVAAVPTSPLTGLRQLSRYLGSVFTPTFWTSMLLGGHAQADANTPDPYGVPQYGFTKAELDLYDPLENAAYVEAHPELAVAYASCFDGSKSFVDATMGDPDYTKCNDAGDVGLTRYRIYLLDQHVSRDFALLYNKTTDAGTAAPGTPTTTSTTPLVCPTTPCNEQTLAQKILANPNITFDLGPNGHIAAPFKDLASGTNARTDNVAGTTDVNPKLLSYILYLGQSHKIKISSLTTGHPDEKVVMHGECHSCGGSVDINNFDGQVLNGTNSASDSFMNTAVPFVPANNGPTFGDGNGHTLPSMLAAGLSAFPDKPNHVHTQIAW